MRKIKNEFMSQWDGLKSRDQERIIVLGATNRPFDLDDAVLRRFPRRIMVDLPDSQNREKILRVILRDQPLEPNFDFQKLSAATEGYSGSDLKNLCIAAAYIPIREFLKNETHGVVGVAEEELPAPKEQQVSEEGSSSPSTPSPPSTPSTSSVSDGKDVPPKKKQKIGNEKVQALSTSGLCLDVEGDNSEPIALRPLRFNDFEASKSEVSVSVNEDAFSISELKKWNEMFGEGGSRNKTPLSYYM